MARPIILSNGEMAVGLNTTGLVHDLYYPYVGMENHTSQRATRHKIGLFVDGAIHWLDDGTWQVKQKYSLGSMVGWTTATNEWLGIAVSFQDFVAHDMDVFARNIHVVNLTDRQRSVKLFLHQAFIIKESADGHDTAQYLPAMNGNEQAILHYKGDRAFVIGGKNIQTGATFDSFSIGCFGNFGDERRDGVWRDAEDGELSRNPVERIQTDSILQFNLELASHDSARVHYYLSAGKTIFESQKTFNKFCSRDLLTWLVDTRNHWHKWLAPAERIAEVSVAPEYRENFLSSLLTLKSMTDRRGAIMASLDTEMLNYTRDAYVDCWPRDASYAMEVFLRLGYMNEVKQYLDFMRSVLTDDGYFCQMYLPDGSVGPNSHAWMHDGEAIPPIQADETASVLLLFAKAVKLAVRRGGKLSEWRKLYEELARPLANFLSDFIDPVTKLPRPSYELWEVRFETTTYTTAITFGALNAAAELAEMFHETSNAVKWRNTTNEIYENVSMLWNNSRSYFYRGFRRHTDGRTDYDETIDLASFYGAWAFGLFDHDKLDVAYNTFMSRFNLGGYNIGAPRFEGDDYNGYENPWFITSFWLAQYKMSLSDKDLARKALDWANGQIARTNILPEQVNPKDGAMLSAAPLSWSHAEFVNTCLDFGNEGRGDAISA